MSTAAVEHIGYDPLSSIANRAAGRINELGLNPTERSAFQELFGPAADGAPLEAMGLAVTLSSKPHSFEYLAKCIGYWGLTNVKGDAPQ